MYNVKFYIKPKDVLNKFSEECKENFNQCVFTDIAKGMDGSVEITCLLFNDDMVDISSERYSMGLFSPKQSEGEWIINGIDGNLIGNWKCSSCKGVSLKDSDYCPNCGAKMKGANE